MTALLWSLAAWCAWTLSTERHHDAHRAVRQRWRAAGTGLLCAACAAALWQHGAALGVLTACGAMTAGGLLTVMLLTWRPHWRLRVLGVALVLPLTFLLPAVATSF